MLYKFGSCVIYNNNLNDCCIILMIIYCKLHQFEQSSRLEDCRVSSGSWLSYKNVGTKYPVGWALINESSLDL